MSQQIALIAALPREIAGLVRGVAPDPALLSSGVTLYVLEHTVVVAAGMGAERASLAVGAALRTKTPSLLVSIGLAGACDPALRAGEAVEAGLVTDARTGERFRTATLPPTAVMLATTAGLAGVAEKARLRSAYGAALVDMEAATVARLAAAHGIAFRAVKGISDAHDFELQELARFAGKQGQFRTAAFALHTALRPTRWRATAQLGRESARALDAMHARVRDLLT